MMYGLVWTKPRTRRRLWPWTIARTVPSWSWTTWAILARVPTAYSSEGSSISSRSAWRWVTRAIGPLDSRGGIQGGDALVAANLERHDHLGEDDGLAQGDERQLPDARHVDERLFVVRAIFVLDLLLVVLVGRPVSHWNLLIESWSRGWPLYV